MDNVRIFLASVATVVGMGLAQAQDRVWQLGGRGASFAEWEAVSIMADERTVPGSLQPWELRPDVNLLPLLTEKHGWSPWQLPFDPLRSRNLPRLWRGFQNSAVFPTMKPIDVYVDGDRTTLNFAVAFGPGGNKVGQEFYTIAPGSLLPLERFVIQEPPEEMVDREGEPFANYVPPAGELTGSQTEEHMLTRDLAEEGRRNPVRDIRYAPLDIELGGVEQNFFAPIVIEFPLQYLRFLRWKTRADNAGEFVGSNSDTRDGLIPKLAYAEFEVYGRGFAAKTLYTSRVVDLGQPATFGEVLWGVSYWRRVGAGWSESTDDKGDVQRTWRPGELVEPPEAGAKFSFRVRNGVDDGPRAYHTWNNKGALISIGRDKWESLRKRTAFDEGLINYRGPVTEDVENWTSWTGRVTRSGFRLNLPSRRFFQVELELTSTRPTDAVRLDSLSIELFPLLAPALVAEVGLADDPLAVSQTRVTAGEPTVFLYALRAEFDGGDHSGFDALRIDGPALPEFQRLLMGDPPIAVEPDSVHTDKHGLTVFLPRPVRDDEQLYIEMKATLYTVSLNLPSEVFDRDDARQRQRVDEGDATDRIGTNRLEVVAVGDLVSRVVDDVRIANPTVTPNGDGINDRIEIAYSLYGVLTAEVVVGFYNLSGERVSTMAMRHQEPGVNRVWWSGMDETGAPLPPGLYVCQVTAKTHRGDFGVTRLVAVAY